MDMVDFLSIFDISNGGLGTGTSFSAFERKPVPLMWGVPGRKKRSHERLIKSDFLV
jgi:hypothetical protein